MAFYLHTSWPSGWSCEDHDGYPPLSMDESPPACGLYEYDYNDADGGYKGREVQASSSPSFPETDPLKFLAWHTEPLTPTQQLAISNVTLRLWYINDHQTINIPGVISLCKYDGADYLDCIDTNYTFSKHSTWFEGVVPLSGVLTVNAVEQLAVYLVHDGGGAGLPVWFMYDKAATNPPGYLSRIEFMGQWTP